jgi:hypothetical protein
VAPAVLDWLTVVQGDLAVELVDASHQAPQEQQLLDKVMVVVEPQSITQTVAVVVAQVAPVETQTCQLLDLVEPECRSLSPEHR